MSGGELAEEIGEFADLKRAVRFKRSFFLNLLFCSLFLFCFSPLVIMDQHLNKLKLKMMTSHDKSVMLDCS